MSALEKYMGHNKLSPLEGAGKKARGLSKLTKGIAAGAGTAAAILAAVGLSDDDDDEKEGPSTKVKIKPKRGLGDD